MGMTVIEIAEMLGFTPSWVRELARNGQIPAMKRGHAWVFDRESVKRAVYKQNSYTPGGKNRAADSL